MISAVAPPGMPIECGMTASWIQRLVNLGSGNMNGSREREISRSNTSGSPRSLILPTKKNNINELQATGAARTLSNKQQAKKVVDAGCGT